MLLEIDGFRVGDRVFVCDPNAARHLEHGVITGLFAKTAERPYEIVVRFADQTSLNYHVEELAHIDEDEEAYAEVCDTTTSPDHYKDLPVEPKSYLVPNEFEGIKFNIIKYASRAGRKRYPSLDVRASEIRDMKKIVEYAQMRINFLEGKPF